MRHSHWKSEVRDVRVMDREGTEAELLRRLPGIQRLWQASRGDRAISIAVLDGAADLSIVNALVLPAGAATEHGTQITSILSGTRDRAVSGIAPGCTIIQIPIFNDAADDERRLPSCTQYDLAKAIDRAREAGADIINISAAQIGDLLALSTELNIALQSAETAGMAVIAAAGNHGCACDTLPAVFPTVLAVGATDDDGNPLYISNSSPNLLRNGISTLGKDIPVVCLGGNICHVTGTSYAAAIVSGVSALILSIARKSHTKITPSELRGLLIRASVRSDGDDRDTAPRQILDLNLLADLLETEGAHTMADILEPAQAQAEHTAFTDAMTRESASSDLAAGRSSAAIQPAGCSCGGSSGSCSCEKSDKKPPQLVYAVGRLGVSFSSLTRRDGLWRQMHGAQAGTPSTPEVDLRPITNAGLKGLFTESPHSAESVIWTLSRSEVPMYAIVPMGAFAHKVYEWMVAEWSDPDVEFMSLPGQVLGQVRLYDGMVVDAVLPDLRGMFSWNQKQYTDAIIAALGEAGGEAATIRQQVSRFLGKIFYRIRNRGLAPEERALNAAATNAFNLSDVIIEAGSEGLVFKDISVEKSPISRPGSEYYDVLFTFFDPKKRLEVAPLLARFTVDVSDTVPVVVGEPVRWYEY